MEFNENYVQTFAKLEAYVGIGYAYLGWESDTEYCIDMWNHTECNDVVNPASYSGSDGIANQMMGVHQEHIGDTITVQTFDYSSTTRDTMINFPNNSLTYEKIIMSFSLANILS